MMPGPLLSSASYKPLELISRHKASEAVRVVMTITPLVIPIVCVWELTVTANANALAHANWCFICITFELAA